MLAQNGDGQTAFQIAAEKNHVDTINKMWVWAEKTKHKAKDMKKNLFLSKDKYGFIAWHRAALYGSLRALETLWSWAKEEELNTEEFFWPKLGIN